MKKILAVITFFIIYTLSLSEVFVKIHEPIRFKDLNTRSLGQSYIVGEGSFEIYTDREDLDLGKKIIFRFPDNGIMTNKKNQIKIDEYKMDNDENSMIISTKREIVKFYALVNRRNIGKNELPEIVEGKYIGYVPVIFSLYEKINNRRGK